MRMMMLNDVPINMRTIIRFHLRMKSISQIELQPGQAREQAALSHQLRVISDLDDAPMVEHHDAIGLLHGG